MTNNIIHELKRTNKIRTACKNWHGTGDCVEEVVLLSDLEAILTESAPSEEALHARCQKALMASHRPYSRTCPVCGLFGKCIYDKQSENSCTFLCTKGFNLWYNLSRTPTKEII